MAWRDVGPPSRLGRGVILAAHGLHVDLPAGWSGRVFSRHGAVATLHAGNFTLALDDGEFGARSTSAMPPGTAFIALTEYRPGSGLAPGSGLFASRRLPVPLDPTSLSANGLAHPRSGHAGRQHFFTASGRPLCLYVVIAAAPATPRRRQLIAVDHVLGSLRVSPRV